jgi:ABC-2 type transport system permease protein
MTARDDAKQAAIVAAYEIRKYLRGRRLIGMLILVVVIVALILALPPVLRQPYTKDPNEFVSTFASFTGLLAILSGVLFASDALCSEHEKRTGYFLFPNPVRRETIVVGKILASLGASALVLLLYYVAAMISAQIVTGSITGEMLLSLVYALAYMLCIVGVAFLLSAVLRGTISSAVLTFFLFTLIFTIVQGLLIAGKVSPWFLPSAASTIIGEVLGPSTPRPGPGGAFEFHADPGTSVAVFVVYFVVGGILAILAFKRRELKT